jgi:hypothetical protein
LYTYDIFGLVFVAALAAVQSICEIHWSVEALAVHGIVRTTRLDGCPGIDNACNYCQRRLLMVDSTRPRDTGYRSDPWSNFVT